MLSTVEDNVPASQKLSDLATQYLRDTIEPGFYASDFSQERFDTLLSTLGHEYGKEKMLARMNIIRSAIYKHFKELDQECEVSIEGSAIKVVNKFRCGAQTAEMNRALLELERSLKSLLNEKEKYALHDNLLCFDKEILTRLYQYFVETELSEESFDRRDMVRLSVQESFDLHSKDIVLFLRGKLYIRYFVSAKRLAENESRRFLGVSPEDLDLIYTKHFPENFGEILLEMAIDVVNDTLNFDRIDNLTFKAKYIEVFRALVDIAMVEYTDGVDEEMLKALNGYVLRLYFDDLLYLCAELLVEKVMDRSKKADEFLRFYNGEIVIGENGKKLKKPFVVDPKGNIWNFGAILSIMTQCTRYESKYDKQREVRAKLEETYKKAVALAAHHKGNETKCDEQLKGLGQKLNTCTVLKNNLLSIAKPDKEKSNELRLTIEEEKRLLGVHAKAYSQKNDVSLKCENAKIAERSRKKQMDMAEISLMEMRKSSEMVFKQKDVVLRALTKALSFR